MGRFEDQLAQRDRQIADRKKSAKARLSTGPLKPAQADKPPSFEPHRIADAFPLIEGREFDELVASIREHGLLNPVVMYQGKVLDGRNRVRACQAAGKEIRKVTWLGECGTPEAFVLARNVMRRHLTADQRAMLGAGLFAGEKKAAAERQGATLATPGEKVGANVRAERPARTGRARDLAGKAVGVSGKRVEAATKLAELDPARAAEVAAGQKTLVEAMREVVADLVPQPADLKAKAQRRQAAKEPPTCPACGQKMPKP